MLFKDGNNALFIQRFGLALAVDVSAACLAYPIDTVRRRLMMLSGNAVRDPTYKPPFTTSLGCVRHILKNEGGVGALYRGCFANNIRAVASALVLVLYDEAKKLFPAASSGGRTGH